MKIFDSLFGKPKSAPTLPTVDYAQAAQQGINTNWQTLQDWQGAAGKTTDFMSKLFSQYSGQSKAADDLVYGLGRQLTTGGQSDLQGDFFKYARRLGLENAAATGAPLSGSFGQSLSSSIGAQQILGNQLTGAGLLQNYSQMQGNRFNSFLAPALGTLQANLVSPGQFMQGAQANNQIQQQNAYIDFANQNRKSWFDNILGQTMQSVVGMPFSLTQNASNVAASSPQIAAGMFTSYFGGSGAGIPAAVPAAGA